MNILELHVKNFYSYEDVTFKFQKYNVLVGPNNSGKTNLVRLLELLKSSHSLELTRFQAKLKFDKEKPSKIFIKITLSDLECKLLNELIFKNEVTLETFPKILKEVEVLLIWSDTVSDEPIPTFGMVRFGNGFTIVRSPNKEYATYSKTIENILDLSDFEKERTDLSNPKILAQVQQVYPNLSENFVDPVFNLSHIKGTSIENFFLKTDNVCIFPFSTQCTYDNNNPKKWISNSIEFIGGRKEYGAGSNLWIILSHILKKSIVTISENLPSYSDLLRMLSVLKSENEPSYDALRKNFRSIFNDAGFIVEQIRGSPQGTSGIFILEGKKRFSLQESASGHLSAITILYHILNAKDCTIILDEPEVHFHPSKITLVAEELMKLTKDSENQIIAITHSPRFLDSLLAHYRRYNIIHLKKNNSSKVHIASKDFVPKIQDHLFNPLVFFEKCVIVVEGPSDEFVLRAISDTRGNIFVKNNIVIVNAHNVNKINPYLEILEEYGIPSVAMVDKEYLGYRQNVVKLTHDLEWELEQLGWKRNQGEKLFPDKAYETTLEVLKKLRARRHLSSSKFGSVFRIAGEKIGESFNLQI